MSLILNILKYSRYERSLDGWVLNNRSIPESSSKLTRFPEVCSTLQPVLTIEVMSLLFDSFLLTIKVILSK